MEVEYLSAAGYMIIAEAARNLPQFILPQFFLGLSSFTISCTIHQRVSIGYIMHHESYTYAHGLLNCYCTAVHVTQLPLSITNAEDISVVTACIMIENAPRVVGAKTSLVAQRSVRSLHGSRI
jgi:hypothetical protein